MTSLLKSFPCGVNVAALMETGDWTVAGMLCCPEPDAADPPGGKRTVPAGIVEEPYTWMGASPAGNVPSVRCHSGPPTRMSDPPWLIQFCNAFNCIAFRLVDVKLSSTMILK